MSLKGEDKTIKAEDLGGGASVHSKTKISVIAVSDVDDSSSSGDAKSKKFVEEEREPVYLDQEAIK